MLDLAIKLGEFGFKLIDSFLGRPRLKVLIKWYLPTDFAPIVRGYLIVANPGKQSIQIRRVSLRQHFPDGSTLRIWWKDETRLIKPSESVEYYFALDESMDADDCEVIDAYAEDCLLKEHRSRPFKRRTAFFKQLLKTQAESPGPLTLFVFPKTYIPTYPHPPNTNLPHSDENPNVTPN